MYPLSMLGVNTCLSKRYQLTPFIIHYQPSMIKLTTPNGIN
jgi:hypothetical protein